jgi:predicted enzyme related to lactoylglutathione lyase
VTVDCADPASLARFWAEVLGFKVTFEEDDEVAIEAPDERGPAVLFLRVPDAKTVKNRLHFDLNPDDQRAEVARVLALGAREVDIGQKEVSWVVLADPEGNEFCILTPR